MKQVTVDPAARDESIGNRLLEGSILAGFLALVFGACLWTILDATRPVRASIALSNASASGQHAARVITASH